MSSGSGRKVAYFSMEVGLNAKIPTYSGGLGVLAGDTLKAAADNEVPIVGMTLLSSHGHFFQQIRDGQQIEKPVSWRVDDFLEPIEAVVEVSVEGRNVKVGCWRYRVEGQSGYEVPVYFLHTDFSENTEVDRRITDYLYGGDKDYRLIQELVLGVGGARMLHKLGHGAVERYHMNEGHSSFLTLELLRNLQDAEEVRKRCLFTTHTPVPAGHDKFDIGEVKETLSPALFEVLPQEFKDEGELNMTALALNLSNYVNGVAKKHAEISRSMFPNYPIHSITNGVHAVTWVSRFFQTLFDEHNPDWRKNPSSLRYVSGIPQEKLWEAHYKSKRRIIDYVNAHTNAGFDYDFFTLGWARRFTLYKRPEFLFSNIERLKEVAEKAGDIQIIYGGKAHPKDAKGKELIARVIDYSERLDGKVNLVYLENYDMYLAQLMTAGVDVWLNTPLPPHEASGTSGMKCALNGVPHLSVRDGWWLEGHVEGETGWEINTPEELYDKLENKIIPMFYGRREEWLQIMSKAISLNGSFFNASRMVNEYVNRAYFSPNGHPSGD